MSDAHSSPDAGHHAASAHDATPHDAAADAAHGHDDGHDAHDALVLGPIDWRMWAAGVVGVAAGLVVVAAFVMGTVGIG